MKTFDVFLIAICLIFIIAIFSSVVNIKSEGVKCASDPLQYATTKLTESNHKEIICQCSYPGSPILAYNSTSQIDLNNLSDYNKSTGVEPFFEFPLN